MEEKKVNYHKDVINDEDINDFCKKVLPYKALVTLEQKRRPYMILCIFCIVLNVLACITHIVLFIKRYDWEINSFIHHLTLYTFFLTILLIFLSFEFYAEKVKKSVIIKLLEYAGTFRFGNISQVPGMVKEISKAFPKFDYCKCSDRYIGRYKRTTVDINAICLKRFSELLKGNLDVNVFEGILIRIPYDKNMPNPKLIPKKEDGIESINVHLNRGYVYIIIASKKLWFTFNLLFPATERAVYNNVIREIIILTKIIGLFVPKNFEEENEIKINDDELDMY